MHPTTHENTANEIINLPPIKVKFLFDKYVVTYEAPFHLLIVSDLISVIKSNLKPKLYKNDCELYDRAESYLSHKLIEIFEKETPEEIQNYHLTGGPSFYGELVDVSENDKNESISIAFRIFTWNEVKGEKQDNETFISNIFNPEGILVNDELINKLINEFDNEITNQIINDNQIKRKRLIEEYRDELMYLKNAEATYNSEKESFSIPLFFSKNENKNNQTL